MRTNVEIDERLIREAMRYSGTSTKKAAVDAGLRMLVQTYKQTSIRRLRGRIRWEGDLHRSRLSRLAD